MLTLLQAMQTCTVVECSDGMLDCNKTPAGNTAGGAQGARAGGEGANIRPVGCTSSALEVRV